MRPTWKGFMAELEATDAVDGAGAVAESRILRAHYELANRVYQARKKKGISQQALAKRSGVDQAEISRIEHGDSNPTMATVVRLLTALGLGIRYPDASASRSTGSKRVSRLRAGRRSRR